MKQLFENFSWPAIWSLPPADFLAVIVMGLIVVAVVIRLVFFAIAQEMFARRGERVIRSPVFIGLWIGAIVFGLGIYVVSLI